MARKSRNEANAFFFVQPVKVERVYSAAIYIRLSVEDNNRPGDSDSLDNQRYLLERFVKAQPDMHLYGVYSDNGKTGTDFDRPAFTQMMDDITAKNIDCVIVKDLSRLGRNYIETGFYLEKTFPYLGVRFVAVNDGYDTLTDNGSNGLVVSLKNLINDIYAKDISKKTASAKEVKQRNGEYLGTFAPYGYMKSEEDKGRLVIDEETAPVVRQIFAWKLEGLGCVLIARRLNEQGILSPAIIQYLRGFKKVKPDGAGALWHSTGIKKLLASPIYAGHMAQGKQKQSLYDGLPHTILPESEWIVVKNTHEPLVDGETFAALQAEREKNRAVYQSRQNGPAAPENVFKGLVYCADCGTKMGRFKSGYNYNFQCNIYRDNLSGTGCTLKSIREDRIFECVYEMFRKEVEATVGMEKLLAKLEQNTEHIAARSELDKKITEAKQNMKRVVGLRASLFTTYADKLLSETEYRSLKRKYDADAAQFDAELAELERAQFLYTKTLTMQNEWITAFRKNQRKKVFTRKLAVELINRIIIHKNDLIEVIWNFRDERIILEQHTKAVSK